MLVLVLQNHEGGTITHFIFQAGIVIAQEAGGFVSGGGASLHDGEITEDVLHGRRYIVIR